MTIVNPSHTGGIHIAPMSITSDVDIPTGYRGVVYSKLTIGTNATVAIKGTGELYITESFIGIRA